MPFPSREMSFSQYREIFSYQRYIYRIVRESSKNLFFNNKRVCLSLSFHTTTALTYAQTGRYISQRLKNTFTMFSRLKRFTCKFYIPASLILINVVGSAPVSSAQPSSCTYACKSYVYYVHVNRRGRDHGRDCFAAAENLE